MPKGNPLGYLIKKTEKPPKKDDKKGQGPKMKDMFNRTVIHGVRG